MLLTGGVLTLGLACIANGLDYGRGGLGIGAGLTAIVLGTFFAYVGWGVMRSDSGHEKDPDE